MPSDRTDFDSIRENFRSQWRSGNRPNLRSFLERHVAHPEFAELAFTTAKIHLSRRLNAGDEAPLVEEQFEMLRSFGVELDDDQRIDLIRLEYDGRWERGESTSARRGDYETRFPEYQRPIGSWVPVWTCPRCNREDIPLADETDATVTCPNRTCSSSFFVAELFRRENRPGQSGLDLRDYVLTGELGKGGMGQVYRSRDPALGRELALKVIHPKFRSDLAVERRFIDEAQILGRLQHPGIVPIYNLGRLLDGRLFISMKLVQGQSLAQLLRQRSDVHAELGRFEGFFAQVCQAVGFAHSRGVIHRDLNPTNVMVGAHGEVQVMDWGLGKVLSPEETRANRDHDGAQPVAGIASESSHRIGRGAVLGTWAYLPPEQAGAVEAATDRRSDVFGLGAILCEILTGKPPYSSYSQAMNSDLSEAFLRLHEKDLDLNLSGVARRCLSRNPEDRPADASVVAELIDRHIASIPEKLRMEQLEAVRRQVTTREERSRRRLWKTMACMLASLTAVAIALAVWAYRAQQISEERRGKLAASQEDLIRTRATSQLLVDGDDIALSVHMYWRAYDEMLRDDWRRQIALRKISWNSQHLASLDQHSKQMAAYALSSDGTLMASGSADRTVRIWNTETKTSVGGPLHHAHRVTAVAFSPDGKILATGCTDKFVRLWDSATFQKVGELQHESEVTALAFSPDGKHVLTGDWSEVRLWNRDDLGHIDTIRVKDFVKAIAVSPDSSRCVIATHDGYLYGWDLQPLKSAWPRQLVKHWSEIASVEPPQDKQPVFVSSLAYSPDGARFLVGTYSGLAFIFDAATGVQIDVLKDRDPRPDNAVAAVAMTPDGTRILTGGTADRTLHVYSADAPSVPEFRFQHESQIVFVGSNSRGTRFISATDDGVVRIWNAATKQADQFRCKAGPIVEGPFAVPVQVVGATYDEREVLLTIVSVQHSGNIEEGFKSTGVISILDARSGFLKESIPIGAVRAAKVGRVDGQGPVIVFATEEGVSSWDGKTHETHSICKLAGILQIAIGRTRRVLAATVHEGDATVHLIDTQTGKTERSIAHPGFVCSLALSPNEEMMLIGSDKVVRLWSCDTSADKPLIEIPVSILSNVAFSPDGQKFALTNGDTIQVGTTALLQVEVLLNAGAFAVVDFSPDGKTLLTSIQKPGTPAKVQFWDVESRLSWGGSIATFGPAAFGGQGSSIVAETAPGRVQVWSIPAPAVDNRERLRLSVECRTGLARVRETGTIHRLSDEERTERYRQLQSLGGPCDLPAPAGEK
jgi:WD40 repeat protein/serine/threonine protein kinase